MIVPQTCSDIDDRQWNGQLIELKIKTTHYVSTCAVANVYLLIYR